MAKYCDHVEPCYSPASWVEMNPMVAGRAAVFCDEHRGYRQDVIAALGTSDWIGYRHIAEFYLDPDLYPDIPGTEGRL